MRYWGKSLHHQNLLNRLWLHLLAFILHLSFPSPKSLLTLSCILFSALINPLFSLLYLSLSLLTLSTSSICCRNILLKNDIKQSRWHWLMALGSLISLLSAAHYTVMPLRFQSLPIEHFAYYAWQLLNTLVLWVWCIKLMGIKVTGF